MVNIESCKIIANPQNTYTEDYSRIVNRIELNGSQQRISILCWCLTFYELKQEKRTFEFYVRTKDKTVTHMYMRSIFKGNSTNESKHRCNLSTESKISAMNISKMHLICDNAKNINHKGQTQFKSKHLMTL